MHMAVCVLCNYLYFCFKSYVWQTIILSMLYVDCIYIYVNKFEARSLFSTSHLKNEHSAQNSITLATSKAINKLE